jgi:Tol biopolymer transport system component
MAKQLVQWGCLILAVAVFMSGCGARTIPDCDETGCIAFTSNRIKGVYHIFVMRPDGSGVVSMVPGREPAWSPDGRHIAFVRESEGQDYVYVLDVHETHVARLTRGRFEERFPTWSPDGRYVAFVSKTDDSENDLCVVSVDGVEEWCYTTGLNSPAWLDWSPSGGKILLSAISSTGIDLFTVGMECIDEPDRCKPDVSQLTNSTEYEGRPDWSPNGNRIIYECGPSMYKVGICSMKADGTNVVQRVSSDTNAEWPTWSPDGRRIAFSSAEQIFVMDVDGSDMTSLTESGTMMVRDSGMPAGYAVWPIVSCSPDWYGTASNIDDATR